jgi:iron complex transport system ATP-binding protein
LHYLDALSGGQKQLVGLAQALIRHPRVLLLDEPLSALDLNYQFHVMRLLKQETQEHGLISIIVLHDLNVALQHADRAVMISSGRLHAEGAPADVITPASLAAVYGVQGRVEACSRGLRQVLIDGLDEHPR